MAISTPDTWGALSAPSSNSAADGDRLTLAVVDPDPRLRTRLALQLGEDGDVVTYPEVAGLAEIERFTRARPDAGAILVAAELSTSLLQQALRSGVRDVLGAPTEATSLAESVERVARTLTMVPTGATSADEMGQTGRVITVSSTKGGSGKSVVATNLATALARRSSRPVVLVDADLQFGDV